MIARICLLLLIVVIYMRAVFVLGGWFVCIGSLFVGCDFGCLCVWLWCFISFFLCARILCLMVCFGFCVWVT